MLSLKYVCLSTIYFEKETAVIFALSVCDIIVYASTIDASVCAFKKGLISSSLWFSLVSSFNGISTFMGYLLPKPSL